VTEDLAIEVTVIEAASKIEWEIVVIVEIKGTCCTKGNKQFARESIEVLLCMDLVTLHAKLFARILVTVLLSYILGIISYKNFRIAHTCEIKEGSMRYFVG
jgi:hypothetical protein